VSGAYLIRESYEIGYFSTFFLVKIYHCLMKQTNSRRSYGPDILLLRRITMGLEKVSYEFAMHSNAAEYFKIFDQYYE
jgi:hypothetical protein